MKKYAAEAMGTFALVFAGCGSVVVDSMKPGAGLIGIAMTFGLIIMAMIYTFGDVSGTHINPAVSIGFFVAGRLPLVTTVLYIIAQLIGAFAAAATLLALFGNHAYLGATLPSGSAGQSFALETLLTALLMLVILNVSTGPKESGVMAGIAIGSVVTLEILFAGAISGASMNPARSLAPAVMSGNLTACWVYIAGPVLGAIIAVPLWKLGRIHQGIKARNRSPKMRPPSLMLSPHIPPNIETPAPDFSGAGALKSYLQHVGHLSQQVVPQQDVGQQSLQQVGQLVQHLSPPQHLASAGFAPAAPRLPMQVMASNVAVRNTDLMGITFPIADAQSHPLTIRFNMKNQTLQACPTGGPRARGPAWEREKQEGFHPEPQMSSATARPAEELTGKAAAQRAQQPHHPPQSAAPPHPPPSSLSRHSGEDPHASHRVMDGNNSGGTSELPQGVPSMH